MDKNSGEKSPQISQISTDFTRKEICGNSCNSWTKPAQNTTPGTFHVEEAGRCEVKAEKKSTLFAAAEHEADDAADNCTHHNADSNVNQYAVQRHKVGVGLQHKVDEYSDQAVDQGAGFCAGHKGGNGGPLAVDVGY